MCDEEIKQRELEQQWEQEQREQDASDFHHWLNSDPYEEVLGG